MENVDLLVLRALRDWRANGQDAVLATVVRTWGSSPRPTGSIMAFAANGAIVGSISGGCVEDDLLHRYCHGAQQRIAGLPTLVKYGVSADEAHRFGLPCGGTLELLLEFNPAPQGLESLVAQLERGQRVQRITTLATGCVYLQAMQAPEGLSLTQDTLTNSFGPEYRLLIIGGGATSELLATMAIFTGFSVTVCDPREEYIGNWSVPQARLTREMPDDVVKSFQPNHRSAVVALTHDPKLDDLCLMQALESDAFYVGAIGSRRNHAARRQRLMEHFDFTEQRLQRLRGPIGLYIGSKTPPEIAVSIMAEMIAAKNQVLLPETTQVGPAKEQRDRLQARAFHGEMQA